MKKYIQNQEDCAFTKLFLFLVITLFLIVPTTFACYISKVHADTIVTANISDNTLWQKNKSPYIISQEITISSLATLTIEPGTVINFDNGSITILGSLQAQGTDSEKISFTSSQTSPSGSLFFRNATATSSLENVIFNHVAHGIQQLNSSVIMKKVSVKNATSAFNIFTHSNLVAENLDVSGISIDAITIYDHSSALFSSSTLSNVAGKGISVFNSSSSTFSQGSIDVITKEAITVFNDSNFILATSTISHSAQSQGQALQAFSNGNISVEGSTISSSGFDASLTAYNKATISIKNSTFIDGLSNAFLFYSNPTVTISNSIINHFPGNGILAYSGGNLNIENTIIKNNTNGIQTYSPVTMNISSSTIINNSTYGIINNSDLFTIEAKNNYWGDSSGPFSTSTNPLGKGNSVVGNVDFTPWINQSFEKSEICCSSVVFIPGVEGSRLYTKGIFGEKQLWEPSLTSSIPALYLDKAGNSIQNIYTKEIIDTTNSLGRLHSIDVYSTFAESMNTLVSLNTIKKWESLPYDWRIDVSDVVNKPISLATTTYSMKNEIEKIAKTSLTGKVTIIAHSNGGLIAKELINQLKNNNENSLIDKVLFVDSPQLGTPKPVSGLLHGDNLSLGAGIIMSQAKARILAQNMPDAYDLLPSKNYFSTVLTPVITFDQSISTLNNFIKKYGNTINSYPAFTDFILGKEGRKNLVTMDHFNDPIIGNQALFTKAEQDHDLIDSWIPPKNIEIYQITGWGKPTETGITYIAKKNCLLGSLICIGSSLDHKQNITNDGDDSVVTPSAVIPNKDAKNYYFNVAQYNKDFRNNRGHSDVLEVPQMQLFIKNTIENKPNSIDYITSEKPLGSKNLEVSVHSPVSLDIYDSQGRHTGLTPSYNANNDINEVEEQIPNSSYKDSGEGKYVFLDDSDTYKIILKGQDLGTFTLNTSETENNITTNTASFENIPVSTSTTATLTLSHATSSMLAIDSNNDGVIDSLISSHSSQDPAELLALLKKTVDNSTINRNLKKRFDTRIDHLINLLQKQKKDKVVKTIERFEALLGKIEIKLQTPDVEKVADILDQLDIILSQN